MTSHIKNNLIGLTLSGLEQFAESIGESKFRGRQIFSWIYREKCASFGEMNNLPKSLREKLDNQCRLDLPVIIHRSESSRDKTIKFLFELHDGNRIESVLIPARQGALDQGKRLTLCISTQVGCPLECVFCATGTMGLMRNLDPSEIVGQYLGVQKITDQPISNIVFMGMGEPLLNYDAVKKSVGIFSDHSGIAISPRRMTVSTAGYADVIRKMASDIPSVKLALSLHSLDNAVRTKLMPITKKNSVEELIDALEFYFRKTKKNVMLEYILFEGINDRPQDIKKIIALSGRFPFRVNLIPFHPINFISPAGFSAELRGASPQSIAKFSKQLREKDIPVFIRDSAGEDIEAACGQLAAKERDK